MPNQQLARGLWAQFASNEAPFNVPNGMEENLRVVDDHLGLYTLAVPQAPGTPLPDNPADGDGQIYLDGSYVVYNGGAWKTYAYRPGMKAVMADASDMWLSTPTGGWLSLRQTATLDSALVAGHVYSTTAAGVAAVADGEYFTVPSANTDEFVILYRRVGAAAVEIKQYPSRSALAEAVALARDWASKDAGEVVPGEFSAKAWARGAGLVDGVHKSAKGYMEDAQNFADDASGSAAEAFGYLQTYRATSYGALYEDPVTDPLGNPPTDGDEYFNITAKLLRRYNGVAWQSSDLNTAVLASPSGSLSVGYDDGTVQDVLDNAKPITDYTALRIYTGRAKIVRITGLYVAVKPQGITGFFAYDSADTTSADNGGTIIVNTLGRRWKRQYDGSAVMAEWFGAQAGEDFDSTGAIKLALNSGAPIIDFGPGTFMCDPISFGTAGQPTLATRTLRGAAVGYLEALSTSEKNITTIKCRTAAPIFWEATLAHRFTMQGITLDAGGLCDATYKITSYCTIHDYYGCSFINAKAGGDSLVIGDAVNLQAEMCAFRYCFFTNTLGLKHSRNVYIAGTNQFNNSFLYCRFMNADYHVWLALGCQGTVIDLCDFYAYTNSAIVAVGASSYTITNNYTESPTGTAFFSESSVVYGAAGQGRCLIENNDINTANGNVTVSPNHKVTVRGNKIGGTLTISAPTTANAYHSVDVYSNQYAAFVDTASCARKWNNSIGGTGQDSDAGQLIAVNVGQGTASADTYRKYKRPIQINTGSIYSSSNGNFNISNNCNAGGDNAVLVAGYGQSLSFGGQSGNISILASTTAAAATGDILTLIGAVVDGSNSAVRPSGDNMIALGRATFRWSTVYAGTGTINTSDEREKQDIASLDDAEKRVAIAAKMLVRKFRFKSAVAAKGDSARIHFGVIAQDVISAFEAEGLDASRYGIICYDEWGAEMDDDGNEIMPAGNRYGVRYEELLAFMIAAL